MVGLGYVGLPLAIELGKAGFHITGIDKDSARVDDINRGVSHVLDVPSDVVARLVREQRFCATDSYDEASVLDVIFICVPTPHDQAKAPDLRYVQAASEEIGKRLRKGQLIVLESTTYPGTTEEVMLPLLQASGLTPGADFAVAFSPERVDPGNQHFRADPERRRLRASGEFDARCGDDQAA